MSCKVPGLHHGDWLLVVVQDTVVQARQRQLPPGTKVFDFATATGLINGIPKTAGSFTFTVQVRDETRATDTETFTVQISRLRRRRSPPRRSPTERSANSTAAATCSPTVVYRPSPGRVVAGAVPPGLELPRGENTISGTPTTAGAFTFTVRVTDDRDAFSEKESQSRSVEPQLAASRRRHVARTMSSLASWRHHVKSVACAGTSRSSIA